MRKAITDTLGSLEREGVLSAEQRAVVERRLAEALAPRGGHAGRFISILAALGAVLVGCGILYLVGYNWDELSKGAKLAIVFGVWLGTHYAGFHLAETPGRSPRVGRAVTAIGILCFGGAIGLVGQIYNLSSEYPNWALAWWALSIPFVLLTSSRAILLLVIALFLMWIFWHTGTFVEHFDQHFDRDFIAAFALVGAGIAVLFSALGRLSAGSRWKRFEPILAGLARPAAIGGAYAVSFKDVWKESGGGLFGGWHGHESLHAQTFLPFGALAVAALLVIGLSVLRMERGRKVAEPLAFLGVGIVLASNLWFWPQGIFLLANLLLLLGILALVWFGVRRGRPGDINWGIAAFVLCITTRYFEYLWDKLEGAYAFIGIGVVLLGAGWVLERNRRKWVAMSAVRRS